LWFLPCSQDLRLLTPQAANIVVRTAQKDAQNALLVMAGAVGIEPTTSPV